MKKRAITLLEIMIVILLIGLIGGVVSYNLKGTLDKGKKFRSEEGSKKLEDILNLEIQMGNATVKDLLGADKDKKILECVINSGFISKREAESFVKDGWGKPFIVSQGERENEVAVSYETKAAQPPTGTSTGT